MLVHLTALRKKLTRLLALFVDVCLLRLEVRRLLVLSIDACLLLLTTWLTFWLRLPHPSHVNYMSEVAWLYPASLLLGLPIFLLTGQYKGLTRYVGSTAMYELSGRTGLLTLLLFCISLVFPLPSFPASSWFLFWILLTCLCGSIRFVLRDLLLGWQRGLRGVRTRVVIYGAGAAGVQLAASLRYGDHHILQAFVDDEPQLWGRSISGVDVIPPHYLQTVQPDQVLLAIPSLQRSSRRRIVEKLQSLGLSVLQVPSIEEITSGRTRIDSLRPIAIEELLGRDPVPPDPQLLGPGISGKVVLVSGAGGSIGSELCRQILTFKPSCLLMLERSEPSLYAIEQELISHSQHDVRLFSILGSAGDESLLQRLFSEHSVEVIFHAAAYKHVPIVESNPLAALDNNILATHVLASAAISSGVESFTLISTDKAVRPTNVMGASKRCAELVLQALAQTNPSTKLSMVRFGNVLGSSGSVVPLFRRQIASGGPITLTHPDIVRFFMTIPEAAQLVLQSAVLACGGDLFLLDMGEPVRIQSLAEQMVRLSGLSLRDASNPGGDIEIICTGLRPGEKLYEELLINGESQPTKHPLIYKAHEQFLTPEQLWPQLQNLASAIAKQDVDYSLSLLSSLVPEWDRTSD